MDDWMLGRATDGSVAVPESAVANPLAMVETELIERARTGDQEAFASLVRMHQRQVYNLALRILRDVDEADEATQEVFLAAWQGLKGFRAEARFGTWLYRITYHHCLRQVENRRKGDEARARLSDETSRERDPGSMLSATYAQDALSEMRDQVRASMAELPARYRSVLVLRHLQDLSYEEMAKVMSVPIGTVKTQLFRARAMLRERLEGSGGARSDLQARADDLRASLGAGLRGLLGRARAVTQHSSAQKEPQS
jgi:RNA polymerase sigma-70 factor, ECF subfamily